MNGDGMDHLATLAAPERVVTDWTPADDLVFTIKDRAGKIRYSGLAREANRVCGTRDIFARAADLVTRGVLELSEEPGVYVLAVPVDVEYAEWTRDLTIAMSAFRARRAGGRIL